MADKTKVIHMSGKRKMSIARATLKPGSGVVRINSVNLNVHPNKIARMKIQEPLILAGEISKKINIEVKVFGGGVMSQSEAARNAVAKALVRFSKDKTLKQTFLDYDRHLLIADTRRTEPHKPCRSAARSAKQTSKR